MKSLYNIIFLSLIVANSCFSFDVGSEAYTRKVSKSFNIDRGGEVMLSNKYGNIDVKTNNGSEVTIDVEIVVNARNEEVANQAFERINIDFESSSDLVSAKTVLESSKGNWWGGGNKSYDFKINYEVSVPNSVKMNVANKYGDVYITELDNDLDLDVKYGKFNVVKAHEVEIECKYGSGEIEACNNINGDLGYVNGSGLKIGECQNAEFESKYSKIYIDNAKTIIADAGYDNYSIGKTDVFKIDGNYNKVEIDDVTDFDADTKYTNININDFRGSLDVEMGYGGIDIYNVRAGFKQIHIDSDYAGVKLRIDSGASYTVDLTTDYAGIEVPEAMNVQVRETNSNSKHVEGSMGANPMGEIRINSDYGSIKIR